MAEPLWRTVLQKVLGGVQAAGQRVEDVLAPLAPGGRLYANPMGLGLSPRANRDQSIRPMTVEETESTLFHHSQFLFRQEQEKNLGVDTVMDMIPTVGGSGKIIELDKRRVKAREKTRRAVMGLRKIQTQEGYLPEDLEPLPPKAEREHIEGGSEFLNPVKPSDRHPLDTRFRRK